MRNINYNFLPIGIIPCGKQLNLVESPADSDDFTRLIKIVFAPHPKTKLPTSDLQVLFSDSVPAEIADWVRKNLQQPQNVGVSSIVYGEQVDDDTLIKLTRQVGEDDRSYINRCDSIIKEFMSNNNGGN